MSKGNFSKIGRTYIFDGSMGALLGVRGLGGGCNEELNLTNPDAIKRVHREYLLAGADIITTNTFGANSIVLGEHGLSTKVKEINVAAVKLARSAIDEFGDNKRFVAGDLGPTSKIPTLGHIDFDSMKASYVEQVKALIQGGVDLFIIETCQDPLQIKTAISAIKECEKKVGVSLPFFVSITVEKSGTMLVGSDPMAVLASISPFGPAAFGLNCATGPDAMEEHIRLLSEQSPFPIICQPNAGLPENINGKAVYPLDAKNFAKLMGALTKKYGVAFAGGCCGTTPEHIAALAEEIKGHKYKKRRIGAKNMVSGLYTAVEMDQIPRPFVIAEQTNVNGSKKFKELLLKDEFDAMAEVAKGLANSAHALDISIAYAGRDEIMDMNSIIPKIVKRADAAIVIDSTSVAAIDAALKHSTGRAIINSINLEDGGIKARKILDIAINHGALVIALTIDESGMAKDAKKKLKIAKRIVKFATDAGLVERDIVIDPLTFTLASGDPSLRNAAKETLEAIRLIKKEIPKVRTILGVSNISFGLPPEGRRALTSMFLRRALAEGLDCAIINPTKIISYDKIPDKIRKLCGALIDNDTSSGDPLTMLINELGSNKATGLISDKNEDTGKNLSADEKLAKMIIDGNREGLENILEEVLKSLDPKAVMSDILLPAMQEVGVRFGDGRMVLPFVLQSAEVMKFACDLCANKITDGGLEHKGTIVLATVRGDVHDIGKNLVDAILTNNGFRVINLGIRQSAMAVIDAVKKFNADAIGLSGLLVSSTEVMKEDLEIFNSHEITLPVLCGGAALTKSFTEKVLDKGYNGKVYYCADAFAGLMAMEEVVK